MSHVFRCRGKCRKLKSMLIRPEGDICPDCRKPRKKKIPKGTSFAAKVAEALEEKED